MQVPYAQVQQDGHELDLNGATLTTAGSVYAEPWRLAGPTPVSPFPRHCLLVIMLAVSSLIDAAYTVGFSCGMCARLRIAHRICSTDTAHCCLLLSFEHRYKTHLLREQLASNCTYCPPGIRQHAYT